MKSRRTKILADIPVELKSIIKTPIVVTPNTSILDARDLLLRYNIGRLIVVSNKKPIGIITEKDIARNVSISGGKPLEKITVGDIMSKDLVIAKSSSSIYDCAGLMKKHRISSIIVENDAQKLAGIVTKTDLVSTFLVQSTASLNVSKIMTKNVITVSPDDSVFVVQSILVNNQIGRLVVTQNQQPVGIITYRDFIPAKTFDFQKTFTNPNEREELYQISQLNEFNVNKLSYMLTFSAKDIMTKNPFIVYSDDVVYTAAILMIRHGISGIPVMKNKRLVGIVTKSDIVDVLAVKGKL